MQTSERQADRPSTEVNISEYELHKVSISANPSTKVVWKTLVHKGKHKVFMFSISYIDLSLIA